MSVDHYAGAAQKWAEGASIVYGPIARQLVDLAPHPLDGHRVLDMGAGTGVAAGPLEDRGARPIATDLSHDMLAWRASARPPAVVADVRALPFHRDVVDDCVAAFVLNHLTQPEQALGEAARVTRGGGALLACVYANASTSAVRDAVDDALRHEGWTAPDWYVELKQRATPILGTAEDMARVAKTAGLVDVVVDERAVDVGVDEPEQLVDYRLGQAHFSAWLDAVGPARARDARERAVAAIRPIMCPYRPVVVFLGALVPTT